jgi:hypothetical protein
MKTASTHGFRQKAHAKLPRFLCKHVHGGSPYNAALHGSNAAGERDEYTSNRPVNFGVYRYKYIEGVTHHGR